MSDFNSFMNNYNAGMQAANGVLGAIQTANGLIQQHKYNQAIGDDYATAVRASAGLSLSPAQQAQMNFNANEAQKQRDYETEMSNTAYQRQVQDMIKAGVNPAMAMNKANGASTPSGVAANAGSPIQSKWDGFQNAVAMKQMNIQTQQMLADLRVKRAEAENIESDTTGKDIQNGYAAEYARLRNEGQDLLNSISRKEMNRIDEEIENLKKQRDVYNATIDKLEEEKNYTITNRDYLENKKLLENITSDLAVELQPFIKEYYAAQSSAQRAQAGLNFVRAAWEKGLYSDDYIFNLQQAAGQDVGIKKNQLARDRIKYNFEELELQLWKDKHGYNPNRSDGFNRLMNGVDITGSVLDRVGISGDKLWTNERTYSDYNEDTHGTGSSTGSYSTYSTGRRVKKK